MPNTKQILELFALSLKEDNYPPVAGRIIGLFYVSNRKYFEFEAIMEAVKASKSATSKALKLLIEFGEVNSIIKEGSKRKRLFFLDIQGNIDRIERLIDSYKIQTELLKETLTYRNKSNEELNQFIKNTINFNTVLLKCAENKLKEYY